jgi:hypothetical protein
MKLACLAGAAAGMLLALELPADNRFFINPRTVLPEATGEEVFVRADNDVDILAFSIGIAYDKSALSVTTVTYDGTAAAGAEFFGGGIDAADGEIGYGCVFDTSNPLSGVLAPGTDRAIAKIIFDVLGASGSSSQLVFQNVIIGTQVPSIATKNVMSDGQGNSIRPLLSSGTITVESRAPVIESFGDNSGYAGEEFTIFGQGFGEAGLAVKVCSVTAAAVLQGDGQTLIVTAPACASVGPALVEVCTTYGCDSDAAGFTYLPTEKEFVRGDVNSDDSIDIADPIRILAHLFVAGVPAAACPDALDANDDGAVNISDSIFILDYVFRGGPAMQPPFPVAGSDPTTDSLATCL